MTEQCQECGVKFLNHESYWDHLVVRHDHLLRDYINKKWGKETECPGQGCEIKHRTKDLSPSSVCPCGYAVGKWAFGVAARFVAPLDVNADS